jgi:hypothetical protein
VKPIKLKFNGKGYVSHTETPVVDLVVKMKKRNKAVSSLDAATVL